MLNEAKAFNAPEQAEEETSEAEEDGSDTLVYEVSSTGEATGNAEEFAGDSEEE